MTSPPAPGPRSGSPSAGDPPRPVVPCVGAIVHDAAGRLLVVRRAHDPDRGSWSVPGGRVEPGEDDVTAVVREVAEETGLAVVAGPEAGRLRVPFGAVEYEVVDLVCHLVDPSAVAAAGDDAADVAWVDRTGLAALTCTPGLVATLGSWGQLPRC